MPITPANATTAAPRAAVPEPPPARLDPGPTGPAFAPLRPAPATSDTSSLMAGVERIFGSYASHFRRVHEQIAAYESREAELRARPDFSTGMQDYRDLQVERMNGLLQLQTQAHTITFGVETAAKVIEHATSGARTVLQTQT